VRVEGSKLAYPMALAVLLTVALTFATLELPVVVNRLVVEYLGFPDFNPGFQSELIEKFMRSHHVRPIGCTALAAVVVLIVLRFVTKRTGLSAAGSMMFFLPTFGYFATYMFFLSGIGILQVVWIPIWGQSIDLLKLGDVAYVPYMIVACPLALLLSLFVVDPSSPIAGLLRAARMIHLHWNGFHVDIRTPIAYALIGCGLLMFLLGTIAWLYAMLQKRETVDF